MDPNIMLPDCVLGLFWGGLACAFVAALVLAPQFLADLRMRRRWKKLRKRADSLE